MGNMKPASPEDPASVVRSQLTAWMAELEVLSRDPRVRKFAELRQKVDEVDVFLGDRRVGGKRQRLGIPDNELSMLKTEDLEDLVTRVPQGLDAVEASVLSTLVGNIPSAELIRVRSPA